MQGDLISKEALLECIRHKGFSENPDAMFEEIIETIEEQPTAYSVEKVVAHLETEKNRAEKSIKEAMNTNGHQVDFRFSNGQRGAYADAIKIVRNGGKE